MSVSRPWHRLVRGSSILALIASLGPAGRAAAQCDPDVDWEIYSPTGDVAEILVDGNQAWIGAVGGVIRIDLSGVSSGEPQQLKITDREGLVSTQVTALARDSFGNLWVGTREDGVSVFDASGRHIANLSSFLELWSDLVIGLAPAPGNRMIVSSANAFSPQGTLEGGGFVIVTIQQTANGFSFESQPGPPLEVAREILAEPGAIWFGTAASGLWLRKISA